MSADPPNQPAIETSLALINERLGRIESGTSRRFRISDYLTAVTIGLSVLLALYSWSKDRDLVRKEQAQLVRARAASAMGKLDKAKLLSMSLFDDSELMFEKGKMALDKLDQSAQLTDANIIGVRNQTFSDLLQMHNRIIHSINDLQMDTAYIDLSGNKDVRDSYRNSIQELRRIKHEAFWDLQRLVETKIFSYLGGKTFESGEFWRDLYQQKTNLHTKTSNEIDKVLGDVNAKLEQIISSTDETLVSTSEVKN